MSADTWAVLVAAGRGERLRSDRPKAFAKLAGRPLLAESLERLEASEWVEAIVVAAPIDWEEPAILVAEEIGAGKVSAVVPGGETRADSVRAALAEVSGEAAVVLVHDAARPLLSEDVWRGPLPRSARVGTAPCPASRSRTRSSESSPAASSRRSTGRTSSRFRRRRRSLPRLCDGRLPANRTSKSDCAAFVEAAGGRVTVVEGDRRLVKVTSQADLDLVETLLGAPGDREST